MDISSKARKSQALIDSIEDLIALERDVSLATERCQRTNGQPQQVMVPMTEVAFMPGTIAGDSVLVGLGQDYFVERTPKEAQAVLRRRIADLSGQARILEEGALLVPPSPPPTPEKPPQKPRRKKNQGQGESDGKIAWAKGFLSLGLERPTGSQSSPTGGTVPVKVREAKSPDNNPSRTPTEIKYNDSEGHEHVVEVEDEGEEPIIEIREWLDESGQQTSVDVTDLGKVLRTAPKAAKAASRSVASAGAEKAGPTAAAAASPAGPDGGSKSSPSDLDSIFASLEEQEEKAEKDAASPSLGTQWKKGFLDGGAKRPEGAPSAVTTGAQETQQAAGASRAVAVPEGVEAGTSKAKSAFREKVVEKSRIPGAPSSLLEEKDPVVPARVSRFKARRQGL
eukprot:g13417.t1